MIVRQGDMLFRKIDNAPGELTGAGKKLVVAEGEKTGHQHVLKSKSAIKVSKAFGGQIETIVLKDAGVLTHDEHAKIDLPAGAYAVTQERELDYADRQMHDVAD